MVSDTQTVCERVLDDELELGVVGAARPQRGLEFEPFLRDELVVIVPPGHHLAAQPAVTLEGLVAEPMLLQQEGSGVRSVVEGAMREGGLAIATCTWRWSSACSSPSRPPCSTGSGSP